MGLAACGDGGGSRDAATTSDTTADAATTTTDAATSTTDAATTATDTATSDAGDVVIPPCTEDALDGCDYPEHHLELASRDFTIEDGATGRSIKVRARAPKNASGKLPVVIWSHGGGFDANGHVFSPDWAEAFASNGYATFNIGHPPPDETTGKTVCELDAIPLDECGFGDDEDANGLLAVFKTHDILALLDRLPAISAASVDAGGPALDLDHIAVTGWSAGSRGTSIVSGAVVQPTASSPVFAHLRSDVSAVIMLSPTGPGFGGYFETEDANSWQDMAGPTLVMTGTNDQKPTKPDLSGPVRRVAYEDQPADGERWLLYSNLPVGVGGHPTYNLEDAASSDERLVRLTRAIRSTALAFLDANLHGSAIGRAWLASDRADILAGDVDWQHK